MSERQTPKVEMIGNLKPAEKDFALAMSARVALSAALNQMSPIATFNIGMLLIVAATQSKMQTHEMQTHEMQTHEMLATPEQLDQLLPTIHANLQYLDDFAAQVQKAAAILQEGV